MRKLQRKAVLSALAVGGALALSPVPPVWGEDAGGAQLVADPYRAVEVVWPSHACKGQDYRFLLGEGYAEALKGSPLADEPFVREAGYMNIGISETAEGVDRLLAVRSVEARDATGAKVPCKFELTSGDRGAVVERNVVSSPVYDIREKYKPATGRVSVVAERPVAELRIQTGLSPASRAAEVSCPGAETEPLGGGGFALRLAEPRKELEVSLSGLRYRHHVGGLKNVSPELRARLKEVPFYVYAVDRGIYGLDAKDVDLSGYQKLVEEFPETYLGSLFGEWDGGVLRKLNRVRDVRIRNLASLCKFPCTRDEMAENFRRVWNLALSQKGPRMCAMSVSALGPTYSCAWGSTFNFVELTSEHRECPFRAILMHMRGATRQFGVPMGVYTAYYRGPYTASYNPDVSASSGSRFGEDFGREPSLSLREHLVSYFMGCNYQSFECMPGAHIKRMPDGSIRLTGNGRAMKAVYDWYKSPSGDRGQSYAPILLLEDRAAGCSRLMGTKRVSDKENVGAFFGAFPPNASDHLCEYAVEALSPYVSPAKKPADFSTNLRNSTLADVFDFYTANPLAPGSELSLEQVSRYSVVMPVSDIRWTEGLAVVLKNYVANGGTLVLTTAHLAPYADDAEFAGALPTGERTADDGLVIDRLDVRGGATVVERTSTGLPLVVRNAFGHGCVLLVASPLFERESDRDTVPPQFISLLERLQAETLPVRVRGACEAMYNVCGDGSWRVVLVNNAGVEKKPDETKETVHPEFASEIALSLPEGAVAEEVRLGAKVSAGGSAGEARVTVPPGEVCVVKVTGMPKLGARKLPAAAPVSLRSRYTPPPATARHPDDDYKYRYDLEAAKRPDPPRVIGRWLKKDGFKDSSGQGNDPSDCGNHLEFAVKAPYSTYSGTFDAVATPSAGSLRRTGKHTEMAGVLRVNDVFVAIRDGYWHFYRESYKRGFVARVRGPKAEMRPTRIRLTFDRGFWRCFVDGVELLQAEGPVKADYEQFANTYHNQIDILFGKAVSWRPNTVFGGELESLEVRSGVDGGDALADRLWMWGHEPETWHRYAKKFAELGMNASNHCGQVEACRLMGIGRDCIIRWQSLPELPLDDARVKEFSKLDELAWSITDSDKKRTFLEKVDIAVGMKRRLPNLTTVFLDDYFQRHMRPMEELKTARERVHAAGLKMAAVMYADVEGYRESDLPSAKLCDVIALWFWKPSSLDNMEEMVLKAKSFLGPDMPLMLGLYMWSFGEVFGPVPADKMKHQLAVAEKLLRNGTVEGLIFHPTTSADMDVPSVNLSKEWIRRLREGDSSAHPGPAKGATAR
ncbi:MAG: hypothetical protein IJG84_16965 [Kiritimatiellae bacterium]|nr:hypothetical protein [Kiritimatiellia bacterium]